MVMGRPNKGAEHVDRCDGSQQALLRAKCIQQTINGELSVNAACAEMGVSRFHFRDLRERFLQGGVDALEPRPPGRPRKRDAEQDAREVELQARIKELERQLVIARAQAELAAVVQKKQQAKRGKGKAR